MPKIIAPDSIRILEERMKTIWFLSWKGYGDVDIASIMNLDRTWVYRLRLGKPKGWQPEYKKLRQK